MLSFTISLVEIYAILYTWSYLPSCITQDWAQYEWGIVCMRRKCIAEIAFHHYQTWFITPTVCFECFQDCSYIWSRLSLSRKNGMLWDVGCNHNCWYYLKHANWTWKCYWTGPRSCKSEASLFLGMYDAARARRNSVCWSIRRHGRKKWPTNPAELLRLRGSVGERRGLSSSYSNRGTYRLHDSRPYPTHTCWNNENWANYRSNFQARKFSKIFIVDKGFEIWVRFSVYLFELRNGQGWCYFVKALVIIISLIYPYFHAYHFCDVLARCWVVGGAMVGGGWWMVGWLVLGVRLLLNRPVLFHSIGD